MKLIIYCFNSNVLHVAVKNENIEIIKLLLKQKNIDIDIKDSILIYIFK